MFIDFFLSCRLRTHPVAQLQALVLGQGQLLISPRARMEIQTIQLTRTRICSIRLFQVLVESHLMGAMGLMKFVSNLL